MMKDQKMNTTLLRGAIQGAETLKPFLSRSQYATLVTLTKGEEGGYFLEKFVNLAALIEAMPVTHQARDDEAMAQLHYFYAGSDWYITEKDIEGGVLQAYGYAILNGDAEMAECGYISIQELTSFGAELDLYFTPRPLAQIIAGHNA